MNLKIFATVQPMESISLSSFVLLEHLAMLLSSTLNKLLTEKLLKQGYRYHKLCKTFKFLTFIDIFDLYLNFKLDINISCAKNLPNLNSMVA